MGDNHQWSVVIQHEVSGRKILLRMHAHHSTGVWEYDSENLLRDLSLPGEMLGHSRKFDEQKRKLLFADLVAEISTAINEIDGEEDEPHYPTQENYRSAGIDQVYPDMFDEMFSEVYMEF